MDELSAERPVRSVVIVLAADQRAKLARVIAVMNRKGGAGKTSVTANVAGYLADAGYRTLIVDLDPQGNMGRNLGYRDTDLNDNGEALLQSLAFGKPLSPVMSIRENLDVVPAGRMTEMLADTLVGKATRAGEKVGEELAQRLADLYPTYQVIFLDCPPGGTVLQTQALIAAKYVLMPTQSDDGSLDGIEQLAEQIAAVRTDNPGITPLGVVLFRLRTNATRRRAEVLEKLSDLLDGSGIPVLKTFIRDVPASADDERAHGKLASELANEVAGAGKARALALREHVAAVARGEVPAPLPSSSKVAASVGDLANDYAQVMVEILAIISEAEGRTTNDTKEEEAS
jgi:cellulose biosynthesis protein BcsQ